MLAVQKAMLELIDSEQGLLNPNGINCIRSFPGCGIMIWGARTLSDDAEWRYINVRRLFNYVEESIKQGTQYKHRSSETIRRHLWQPEAAPIR